MLTFCMEGTPIRQDENGVFGVVEKFKVYDYYGYEGSISALCGYDVLEDNTLSLSEPYALRRGLFVPLKEVADEMGLERYLRAKRPIYTILKNRPFFAAKICKNFKTGEYLEAKSLHNVLSITSDGIKMINDSSGTVSFTMLQNEPKEFFERTEEIMRKVASCKSRAEFLEMRMR